jgi:thioredoxin-like negative regulator of GroEL
MNELRQLFAAGRHAEVIATAQALLDSDTERHQVRAYLAMAHCSNGDAERAQVEAEKLPDSRKSLVVTKCKSVGITLTVGRP